MFPKSQTALGGAYIYGTKKPKTKKCLTEFKVTSEEKRRGRSPKADKKVGEKQCKTGYKCIAHLYPVLDIYDYVLFLRNSSFR